MKKRKKYCSLREIQTKLWGMFADFGACSRCGGELEKLDNDDCPRLRCSQCGNSLVESPEEGKERS